MVYVSLHWSKYGADNIELWGFVVEHVLFHNHIPNHLSGLTPMDYSSRPRQIIMTFFALMFGDSQSMTLIQNYKIDTRFLSEIVDHIWVNCWDSMIFILLLQPIYTSSLLVTLHHSIIWFLMTCLNLNLSLAIIPWLTKGAKDLTCYSLGDLN